jgi:mRNA interferase MazF
VTDGPLRRGDIVLTRFPFTDLAGSAVRPALVVSQGQVADDVVLMAVSSVLRRPLSPTDVLCETTHEEFPATGLKVTSVFRVHKLVAIEARIVVRRLGLISPRFQAEVDQKLRAVLGLLH